MFHVSNEHTKLVKEEIVFALDRLNDDQVIYGKTIIVGEDMPVMLISGTNINNKIIITVSPIQ